MNISMIDKSMNVDNFLILLIFLTLTECGRALITIKILSNFRFSYNLHLAVSKCKRIIDFKTIKKSPLSKNIYPRSLKHIFLLMDRKTFIEAKFGNFRFFHHVCS